MKWGEFLDMEPRQLIALSEAIERKQETKTQQHAQFMALVANCHKGPKQKAFKPSDFLPQIEREEVDNDALYQKFMAINSSLGGEIA